MYKIGEFSKKVDISIRTLRYYDEYGVLVPNKVDKLTGYRFYDEANLQECELIKLLKSVNFTLEEIKKYKRNLSAEVLDTKGLELLNEIKTLRKKYNIIKGMQTNKEIYAKVYKKEDNESANKVLKLYKKERKKNEKNDNRKNT